MYRWVCKMYYQGRLYSGYYWGHEYSLARARKEMQKMQGMHAPMTFELTDLTTGAIIKA